MLFGPADLAPYEIFSPIPSMTYVDPDGTCRIYYGAHDLPESSFNDIFKLFGKTTDIRNIELHYHVQPDNIHERFMYPSLPSMKDFRKSCPIWHFVDAAANDKSPKPTCNIIITYHGKGELPFDYDAMLNPLLGLMGSLTLNGFENVAVKVVPGTLYDGSKCPLPLEMSMRMLRYQLEKLMGVAKMTYAGDACRMKFCPRQLADMWAMQVRGGEATRTNSWMAIKLHGQRRAKRELRRLLGDW